MYSKVAEGARMSPSVTRCGALRIFQRATALVHSPGSSRQRDQAGAGVFAALGVVRRGRRHAVRPVFGAGLHHLVKGIGRKRRRRRFAADLVEREQAVDAIERRVLQRFRHQRAGELLHLQGKAAHPWRAVCSARPGRSDPSSAHRAGNRTGLRRQRTSRRAPFRLSPRSMRGHRPMRRPAVR